jgi:hypothetical protein
MQRSHMVVGKYQLQVEELAFHNIRDNTVSRMVHTGMFIMETVTIHDVCVITYCTASVDVDLKINEQ